MCIGDRLDESDDLYAFTCPRPPPLFPGLSLLQAARAINTGTTITVFGIQEAPLALQSVSALPGRTGGCLFFYTDDTVTQLAADLYEMGSTGGGGGCCSP